MSRPYQFRDYPLLWFMSIVVCVVTLTSQSGSKLRAVEFTFDRPCCNSNGCRVTEVLTGLATVRDVQHIAGDNDAKLVLRADPSLSPYELWTTVTAAHQAPTRMTVSGKTFSVDSIP